MTNHTSNAGMEAVDNVALEGPKPSVVAIAYSSRKLWRISDTLSILRYGPVSVDIAGQNGTSFEGAGSLETGAKTGVIN
jgi:hypothetical protein